MRADDGRVISNLICQALGNEDITIYGDGSQTCSYSFVGDIVEGLVRLADHDGAAGIPVNLGNPDELTEAELARLVIAMAGSKSPITYRPLPVDDPKRRKPDISRARELLRWEPTVPLREGLGTTIAWFAQPQNRAVPSVKTLAESEVRLSR